MNMSCLFFNNLDKATSLLGLICQWKCTHTYGLYKQFIYAIYISWNWISILSLFLKKN